MSASRLYLIIAVLAVAGVIVSSVSLQNHYSTAESSFCNINQTLNCDIVNRSIYSRVAGIPVALIGVLGYLALLALAAAYRSNPQTPKLLAITSLLGLVFALYLTYIEGFVLAAWCILCLTSLFLIFDITVVSAILMFRPAPDHH